MVQDGGKLAKSPAGFLAQTGRTLVLPTKILSERLKRTL